MKRIGSKSIYLAGFAIVRHLHVTRILTGLLLGFSMHLVYQFISTVSTQGTMLDQYDKNCPPCEDPGKVRAEPCLVCGPTAITMDRDPAVVEAYKPKGMYEVTRWYYFNEEYLYDIINGKPKVKLLGSWYEETKAVTQVGLEYINANEMLGKTWSLVRLKNGYLRRDVFRGTDYILDIDVKSIEKHLSESISCTFRVRLVHAFDKTGLQVVEKLQEKEVNVHIVVPVSGDEKTLESFVKRYVGEAEKQNNKNLEITLVLFKGTGLFGEKSGQLKPLVEKLIKENSKSLIKYIELAGDYNYLKGIQHGTANAKSGDVILTLKIDMTFGQTLLETCRTIPKYQERVYFPIAFSQYDPDTIERGMPPGKPKNINKLDINKFTGYWTHKVHDFMCMYYNDAVAALNTVLRAVENGAKVFDDIGSEGGVRMYDTFISSNIDVISAVEPDLMRMYHVRTCNKNILSKNDYHHCFQLKAETLGSKPALSILYITEIEQKKV